MSLLQFDTGRNADALASARGALHTFRRLLTTDPDDHEAIGEIQEYSEKYRDRLVKAGRADAAKELIRETTAFAEASGAEQPAVREWAKLLASLRDSAATLNGTPATGSTP
jgi:hypothetical protein